MLERAGLRKHIALGRDGVIPRDPMKAGKDLSGAPHIIIPLLGEFKGELGYRYHLSPLQALRAQG